MSDVNPDDRERLERLASSLLRSAKDDGLDDARLGALGRRLGIPEESAAAATKMPVRAVLLAGGLAILGGSLAYYATSSEHPARRASVPAPPASPVATTTASESGSVRVPPSPVAVGHLPDAPSAAPARPESARRSAVVRAAEPASKSRPAASSRESTVSAEGSGDDLQAELLAVERVQRAIAERRVGEARAALGAYDRAFPKKLLQQEARVLEIEVLFAEDRREDAQTRADAFLAGPEGAGPYAARVRSLVARSRTP